MVIVPFREQLENEVKIAKREFGEDSPEFKKWTERLENYDRETKGEQG